MFDAWHRLFLLTANSVIHMYMCFEMCRIQDVSLAQTSKLVDNKYLQLLPASGDPCQKSQRMRLEMDGCHCLLKLMTYILFIHIFLDFWPTICLQFHIFKNYMKAVPWHHQLMTMFMVSLTSMIDGLLVVIASCTPCRTCFTAGLWHKSHHLYTVACTRSIARIH